MGTHASNLSRIRRALALAAAAALAISCMLCLPGRAGAEQTADATSAYALLYEDGALIMQRGSAPDEAHGQLVGSWTGFEEAGWTSASKVPWYASRALVKSIQVKDAISPVSTAYWFYGFTSCTSADLSLLDLSATTSMSHMFASCKALEGATLPALELPVCTDASYLFYNCTSLTDLDLSGMCAGSCQNASYMLFNCASLAAIDLSSFDSSSILKASSAFTKCSSASCVTFGEKWTFSGATGSRISGLNLPDAPTSSPYTGMWVCTQGASSGSTYDDPSKIPDGAGTYEWEHSTSDLRAVLYEDGTLVFQMAGSPHTEHGEAASEWIGFDTAAYEKAASVPWYASRGSILAVECDEGVSAKSCAWWFYGCAGLISADLSNLDVTQTASIAHMFQNCTALTELRIDSWSSESIQDASYAFASCKALKTFDSSSATISGIPTMSYLLYNCTSLSKADMSGFDTSSVTRAYSVFTGDKALADVTLGAGWTFSGATGSRIAGLNLPAAPSGSPYTGRWLCTQGAQAGREFARASAIPDGQGTYVWASTISQACAILYEDGSLIFQEGTSTDPSRGDAVAIYTDFEDAVYTRALAVPWSGSASLITSVAFADEVSPASTAYWFSNLTSCTSIDLGKLDTSRVATMAYMFYNCASLTSLDVSALDVSRVENMTYLFCDCASLVQIDGLGSWQTSSLAQMNNLFRGCSALASLDLSGFDTANVTIAGLCFYHNDALSKVTFGQGWSFEGSTGARLSGLNIPAAPTAEPNNGLWVATSGQMTGQTYSSPSAIPSNVAACYEWQIVTELALSATSVTVEDEATVAYTTNSPGQVSAQSSNDGVAQASATDGSIKLTAVSPGAATVTVAVAFSGPYAAASTEIEVVVPTDTTAILYSSGEFVIQHGAEPDPLKGDVASTYTGFDTARYTCAEDVAWHDAAASIKSVVVADEVSPECCAYWFSGLYNCTAMDLANLDTSKAVSIHALVSNCSKLTQIDGISGFDTHAVTDMDELFTNCRALTTLDLSGFDTHAVTSASRMFHGCTALADVTLGEGWTFSGATGARIDGMNLPAASTTTPYIGKWALKSDQTVTYDSPEDIPDGQGRYVWAMSRSVKYAVLYEDGSLIFQADPDPLEGHGEIAQAYTGFEDAAYTSASAVPWYMSRSSITSVSFETDISPVSCAYWFYGCANLTAADLDGLDAQACSSALRMFANCTSLASVSLSSCSFPALTDASYMFSGCKALAALDLSQARMESLTQMPYMFYNCSCLSTLDLSGVSTANVTSANLVFRNCSSLCDIALGGDWSFSGATGSRITGLNFPDAPTEAPYNGRWALQTDPSVSYESASDIPDGQGRYVWGLAEQDCYALLYEDGALIFQQGSEQTEGHGAKVASYTGFTKKAYSSALSVPWYANRASIKTVSFADEVSPVSCAYWFYYCTSLASLDASGLDLGSCTDLSYMFKNCTSLTALDLSGKQTGSITSLKHAFYGCTALEAIDLSGWDTASVSDMSSMFYNCASLTSLDLSSFDTANVTEALTVFTKCSSLCDIALGEDWSFSGATGSRISGLNLPAASSQDPYNGKWVAMSGPSSGASYDDAAAIPDGAGRYMWQKGATITVDPSTVDVYCGKSAQVAYAASTDGAVSATSSDEAVATVEAVDEQAHAIGIKAHDAGIADIEVTLAPTGQYSCASALIRVNVDAGIIAVLYEDGALVFQSAGSGSGGHSGQVAVYSGFADKAFSSASDVPWDGVRSSITQVSFTGTIKPVSCAWWFCGCENLLSADVSLLDASACVDATSMFKGCTQLTGLNAISQLDTGCLADATSMFEGCSSIASLDLSGWDAANLASMSSMFCGCASLASLDVSGWQTSAVTSMSSMFKGCTALTSLDLTGFDTSGISSATDVFSGCQALSCVTLGQKWSFKGKGLIRISGLNLPDAPTSSPYTGMWKAATGPNAESTYKASDIPDNVEATYKWDDSPYAMVYSDGTMVFQRGNTPDPDKTLVASYTGFEKAASYATAEYVPWHAQSASITSVCVKDQMSPASLAYWFSGFTSLTSADLSAIDSANVKCADSMFAGCAQLAYLDVSFLEGAPLETARSLFINCTDLAAIDAIGALDLSQASSTASLFAGCASLTDLDLSGWATPNLTSMYGMFAGCTSLQALDISGLSTAKVGSAAGVFSGCSSLSSIRVGKDWAFEGAGTSRIEGLEFPSVPDDATYEGLWVAASGKNMYETYTPGTIPSNVEANYIWSIVRKLTLTHSAG